MTAAGELMVMEVVTFEENFHVCEGADGHAAFADFAFGERVVGVVAHQRGQVKGSGEAGLPLREEITEALVGIFRGAEAGELAHGPKAAAVHGGMNAARVGRVTGEAELAIRVPVRKIRLRVKAANGVAGNRGELGLSLGIFFKRGLESVLFPGLLFGGGLAMGGRSVRRGCGLRGAFGFFAHGPGSRGTESNSETNLAQNSMLFER